MHECILCGSKANVQKIPAEDVGLSDDDRDVWVCEKHNPKERLELSKLFGKLREMRERERINFGR